MTGIQAIFDMVDQGWHILQPGGLFITLSEYERDTQMAKLHKKIYGKCGETPSSEAGMAFFSTKKDEPRERRRHEVSFHAKLGDGPALNFLSRPGLFSYGRRICIHAEMCRQCTHKCDRHGT